MKVRSRDVNKALETYALLDSRSEIFLCDKTLAIELGVLGQEKHSFRQLKKEKTAQELVMRSA